jgi:predicted peptidase
LTPQLLDRDKIIFQSLLMRRIPSLLLFLFMLAGHAAADDFVARLYMDASGKSMPFQLLIPTGYDKTQKYPVMLFFHGAGERGTDNVAQMINGAWNFGDAKFQAQYHSFIIVPQCPPNQQWVDMPWSATSGVRPAQPSQPMQLALKILDEVESEFSIDKNRVYVVGLSMGGYGVWDCVTRDPGRYAAGVICCGGGDESTVTAAVARVPVWVFHSADDGVVPVVRDRNMVAAMIKMGGHPRYIEYLEGIGHGIWGEAWNDSELFPWLYQEKLPHP